MIESVIQGLRELLGRVMTDDESDPHDVVIVWTDDPAREDNTKQSFISYLQLTNIEPDTENGQTRRRTITGMNADGTSYTTRNITPVKLTFSWKFPLNRGADRLYRWIQVAYMISNGDANFTLGVPVGDTKKLISVQVGREDGSITFPTFEGDVRESTVPTSEIFITVRNAFVLLPEEHVPALAAVKVIEQVAFSILPPSE